MSANGMSSLYQDFGQRALGNNDSEVLEGVEEV